MKNMKFVIAGLALLLIITGAVIVKVVSTPKPPPPTQITDESTPDLPPADASIQIDLARSKADPNTVTLAIKGLGGKYTSMDYELQYDSQGLIQGVTSGNKPLDLTGKDTFSRDIYLGTCSKNVCRPHPGVSKVSVTLVFTDKDGKKSQFTKDYDIGTP